MENNIKEEPNVKVWSNSDGTLGFSFTLSMNSYDVMNDTMIREVTKNIGDFTKSLVGSLAPFEVVTNDILIRSAKQEGKVKVMVSNDNAKAARHVTVEGQNIKKVMNSYQEALEQEIKGSTQT